VVAIVTGLDFLLITIYLICVSLVLERMRSALFVEQVEIIFDANDFQSQLESHLLQEVIKIEFSLTLSAYASLFRFER